jgi:Flp pilus assembly pilin Flp
MPRDRCCGCFEASARPSPSSAGLTRLDDERGQGTVEYGLLIGAGAVLVIAAMLALAGGVKNLVERTGSVEHPQQVLAPPVRACVPSYQGVCIPPPPPDLDCADIVALGIAVPVTVVGNDPHGLDPDGDGLGC